MVDPAVPPTLLAPSSPPPTLERRHHHDGIRRAVSGVGSLANGLTAAVSQTRSRRAGRGGVRMAATRGEPLARAYQARYGNKPGAGAFSWERLAAAKGTISW
jgi:hypothetical protein